MKEQFNNRLHEVMDLCERNHETPLHAGVRNALRYNFVVIRLFFIIVTVQLHAKRSKRPGSLQSFFGHGSNLWCQLSGLFWGSSNQGTTGH